MRAPLAAQVEHTKVHAGSYFVGRKVRIPSLGAGRRFITESDVNGRVRGFNETTKRYTVAMDSGALETQIKGDDIKVIYSLLPCCPASLLTPPPPLPCCR